MNCVFTRQIFRSKDACCGRDLLETVEERLAPQVGVDQRGNDADFGTAQPDPDVFLSKEEEKNPVRTAFLHLPFSLVCLTGLLCICKAMQSPGLYPSARKKLATLLLYSSKSRNVQLLSICTRHFRRPK